MYDHHHGCALLGLHFRRFFHRQEMPSHPDRKNVANASQVKSRPTPPTCSTSVAQRHGTATENPPNRRLSRRAGWPPSSRIHRRNRPRHIPSTVASSRLAVLARWAQASPAFAKRGQGPRMGTQTCEQDKPAGDFCDTRVLASGPFFFFFFLLLLFIKLCSLAWHMVSW